MGANQSMEMANRLICCSDLPEKGDQQKLASPPPCTVGELLHPEFGFRYKMTKGICYPPWADDQESAIEELMSKDWLKPTDIVVATYPKAGTTLMQQMVMLLLNGGETAKVGDVMVTSAWIERDYCIAKDRPAAWKTIQEKTTANGTRRVLKTHAPYELFPASTFPSGVKLIVVVRDPRDVLTSMYKHYSGIKRFSYTGSLEHFIEIFKEGNVGHGSYFDHLKGWWRCYEEHGNETVLWLKYEDVILDKRSTAMKIANFIGVSADEALLDKVCGGSNIESMKKEAAKRQSSGFGSQTHFNKGVRGNWKSKLTVAQAEDLNAFCEEQMAGSEDIDVDIEM